MSTSFGLLEHVFGDSGLWAAVYSLFIDTWLNIGYKTAETCPLLYFFLMLALTYYSKFQY